MKRKHILIYAVAPESGGPLSVLDDYYRQVVELNDGLDIDWFFVISKPCFPETKHIHILRFPWVKKSVLHRIYFDYILTHLLIKKYKIDYVVSLQNITLPLCRKPQIVSLHNALPLFSCGYSIMGTLKGVIKQFLVNIRVYRSLKKADAIIAPAYWIRDAYIRKLHLKMENWYISPMEIHCKEIIKARNLKKEEIFFFYPAGIIPYKSHMTIIYACKLLKQKGVSPHIIFTDTPNRNKLADKISSCVAKYGLDVNFVGFLPRSEVYEYYARSVLIFPSFIETDALPLEEGVASNCYILAADTPFSREILDNYPNCDFFSINDAVDLSSKIEKILKQDIIIHKFAPVPKKHVSRPLLCLEIIKKIGEKK